MKKIICIRNIVVFVCIISLLLLLILNATSSASGSEEIYSEKEILQAQLERGNLCDELGKESVYPEYYVAQNVTNISKAEIEEGILENEALLWYANKNNISVNDSELQLFINKLLKDSKEADEYPEYTEAAKELGSTYEDIIIGDAEAYRDVLIKSKLYEKYITGNQKIVVTNETIDDVNKQNEEKWNSFVENIITQYKKALEYKNLVKEFNVCEKLSNNNITDIKKIKLETQRYK